MVDFYLSARFVVVLFSFLLSDIVFHFFNTNCIFLLFICAWPHLTTYKLEYWSVPWPMLLNVFICVQNWRRPGSWAAAKSFEDGRRFRTRQYDSCLEIYQQVLLSTCTQTIILNVHIFTYILQLCTLHAMYFLLITFSRYSIKRFLK